MPIFSSLAPWTIAGRISDKVGQMRIGRLSPSGVACLPSQSVASYNYRSQSATRHRRSTGCNRRSNAPLFHSLDVCGRACRGTDWLPWIVAPESVSSGTGGLSAESSQTLRPISRKRPRPLDGRRPSTRLSTGNARAHAVALDPGQLIRPRHSPAAGLVSSASNSGRRHSFLAGS